MDALRRVELLIRLACGNANPHEAAAAWAKAKQMMRANGVDVGQLCNDVWIMYGQLEGPSSREQDPGTKDTRTHNVYQGNVRRAVDSIMWLDLICQRCGKTFSYEAYPGNPRSYCDGCRNLVKREADAARKRAARAAKHR